MKKLWLALLLALFALPAQAAICSTVPYTFIDGTVIQATQVNANFASMVSCINAGAATAGANSNITSLTGLTTPLSISQGGTGSTTGNFSITPLWTNAGGTVPIVTMLSDPIIFGPAYGADPTGANDNTSAFLNFWNDCMTYSPIANQIGGHMCFVPPGHYKFTQNVLLDTYLNPNGGFTLYGGGPFAALVGGVYQGTLLDFSSTSGKNLSISSSVGGGAVNASGGKVIGLGVLANASGIPALQLGRSDLGDAINGFQFNDLWVENNGGGSTTSGIQINLVLESIFTNDIVNLSCPDGSGHNNCASYGDAWQLESSSFNVWNSGSGGHAGNAWHLTNSSGSNYANTINAFDCEIAFNCVTIDSHGSAYNSWHNGQWDWGNTTVHGSAVIINADGTGCPTNDSDIFDNPNLAFSGSETVLSGTCPNSAEFRGPLPSVVTPSIASLTTISNTQGRRVTVMMYGGAISQVCILPYPVTLPGSCMTNGVNGVPWTVTLRPQDSIRLTEAGAGWLWFDAN